MKLFSVCLLILFTSLSPHSLDAADSEPALQEPPQSAMKTTIIGVLIATSLVSLFLIVERGIALRREAVIPGRLVEAQSVCQTQEELLALRTTSNQLPSPYGRLLSCAIHHLDLLITNNTHAKYKIMNISTIDIVVFSAYCLLILFIGLYVSREKKGKVKSAEDYFIAGKSLPWWAIGAS